MAAVAICLPGNGAKLQTVFNYSMSGPVPGPDTKIVNIHFFYWRDILGNTQHCNISTGNILVPGFRLIVAGEGHFHNTLAARQIEINISGPPTTAGHHLHCSSELETRSLNKPAEI